MRVKEFSLTLLDGFPSGTAASGFAHQPRAHLRNNHGAVIAPAHSCAHKRSASTVFCWLIRFNGLGCFLWSLLPCLFPRGSAQGGPCGRGECNVCSICTHGFRLRDNVGGTAQQTNLPLRYGPGLYFSSVSGKANDYAAKSTKVCTPVRDSFFADDFFLCVCVPLAVAVPACLPPGCLPFHRPSLFFFPPGPVLLVS